MTDDRALLWSVEETLCSHAPEINQLPFGIAYADPRHPSVPDANRLVVREPSALTPGVLETALREHYEKRGIRSVEVLIPSSGTDAPEASFATAELVEILDRDGLDPAERVVLVHPLACDAPATGATRPEPPGFDLRDVENERDWIAVETLESEAAAERDHPPARRDAFGRWLRSAAAASGATWVLATLSGAPAGCAGSRAEEGTARLLRLVERPVMRRRGVGRAIIESMLRRAGDSRCDNTVVALDSEDDLLTGTLEGFRQIGRVHCWERTV